MFSQLFVSSYKEWRNNVMGLATIEYDCTQCSATWISDLKKKHWTDLSSMFDDTVLRRQVAGMFRWVVKLKHATFQTWTKSLANIAFHWKTSSFRDNNQLFTWAKVSFTLIWSMGRSKSYYCTRNNWCKIKFPIKKWHFNSNFTSDLFPTISQQSHFDTFQWMSWLTHQNSGRTFWNL